MPNASSPFNMSSAGPERENCPYLQGLVWRKSYLTEDNHGPLVAEAALTIIVTILTILLNSLVIVAVATRRRLQTNSNILLACLAVTDLLTGLVVQPIRIAMEIKRIVGVGPFCGMEKLFTVSITLVTYASCTHLVLTSIERYIAIKHSLRYQTIVTKQWILIGVLLCWAFTMLVTSQEIVLAVMNPETKMFSSYLHVWHMILPTIPVLFYVVMIYTNCYIFSEARRQEKRIQTEQMPHEEAKRVKKENKAAKTIIIIFIALMLTYLPTDVAAISMAQSLSENSPPDSKYIVVYWCTMSFILLASLVNPIIFCWRSKKIRIVFLEILHFRNPRSISPAT